MNKGFSLVELIVVIAIMAILVGVAVPVYTSYISKANVAVDQQAVDNLKHACDIVAVEYDVTITYTYVEDTKKITAAITADANSDKDEKATTQLTAILGSGDFSVTLKGTYTDSGENSMETLLDIELAD